MSVDKYQNVNNRPYKKSIKESHSQIHHIKEGWGKYKKDLPSWGRGEGGRGVFRIQSNIHIFLWK